MTRYEYGTIIELIDTPKYSAIVAEDELYYILGFVKTRCKLCDATLREVLYRDKKDGKLHKVYKENFYDKSWQAICSECGNIENDT